jgi:hypothetical protein
VLPLVEGGCIRAAVAAARRSGNHFSVHVARGMSILPFQSAESTEAILKGWFAAIARISQAKVRSRVPASCCSSGFGIHFRLLLQHSSSFCSQVDLNFEPGVRIFLDVVFVPSTVR